MKLTVEEILKIMDESDYEYFGIRSDRAGIVKVGETFEASHQWYQDYIWDDTDVEDIFNDPEHPFDADMGCWDDGELYGTCSIGIADRDAASVEAALKAIEAYRYDDMDTIYLIAGDYAEGGNDIGESIIHNAECLAIID